MHRKRIALICLLLSWTALMSRPVEGADWDAFRGNPFRQGRVDETITLPFHPLWQYRTDGRIDSSPAVVEDRLYFGSMDGFLYCLDVKTGRLLWKYDGGGTDSNTRGIISSPCVDSGRVYAETRCGRVLALDFLTGNLIWSQDYGGQNLSSPVVSEGKLICGAGYPVKSLAAFDAVTGQKLWETATNQYVHSSAAIANFEIFIGCNDGSVSSYDLRDGRFLWTHSSSGRGYLSTPVLDGDTIYFAPGDFDRRVFALNSSTGETKWSFEVPKQEYQAWSYVSSPTVTSDTLYIVAGCPTQILYALDKSTGKEKWETPLGPSDSAGFASSPACCNNFLAVGSWNGNLSAIDLTSASILQTATLPGKIGSSPAISNGRIFVGCEDGNLYAYSTVDQAESFSTSSDFLETGWNFISIPAIPQDPSPQSVFAGIDVPSSSLQFWTGNSFQRYGESFGWTGPIELGIPYWILNLQSPQGLQLQGIPITSDQILTFQGDFSGPHWIAFGVPMNQQMSISDLQFKITSGSDWFDWDTAVNRNWITGMAQGYNAESASFFTVGINSVSDTSVLEPWKGYWLLIMTPDTLSIRFPFSKTSP